MNPLSILRNIGFGTMRDLAKVPAWLAEIMKNRSNADLSKLTAIPNGIDWVAEKEDILGRANYLCSVIVREPDELLKSMPEYIGEEYQGQWAIYCCSMLTHALANISVIYPETKAKSLTIIPKLIDAVNTPAIRKYDTMCWHEDAIESLDGNKSHMTYLSILAWMITNYRLIGGDTRYDALLHQCCEALDRRMRQSRYDLNLLSFPNLPIFLPDMVVALIALRNYGRLFDGKYQETVEAWLHNAKTKWIHRRSGLLACKLPGASRRLKYMQMNGTYSALNCSYLALVDKDFAREQHKLLKQRYWKRSVVLNNVVEAIHEYDNRDPKLQMKAGDAGVIFEGITGGGNAFALGSATMLGDWHMRYHILRLAELAGGTIVDGRKRHYRLADFFLVGEATALAMRTQITR